LQALATCAVCLEARRARLLRLNLEQRDPEPIRCAACGGVIGTVIGTVTGTVIGTVIGTEIGRGTA
jgi:hypothetical protein